MIFNCPCRGGIDITVTGEAILVDYQNHHQQVEKLSAILPVPSSLDNQRDPVDQNLYFRSNRKMIKVSLDEILYVESLKDYIKVVTPTKTIITKQSISSLEDSLPRENFIRIHRSFIISLSKIESYNSEMVEIAKKEFPISRMYKHEVEKILHAH